MRQHNERREPHEPREPWEPREPRGPREPRAPVEASDPIWVSLPSPEQLVHRPTGVKITINLSEESLAWFKEQGDRLDMRYQRMIRNLLDEYVRQMKAKGIK